MMDAFKQIRPPPPPPTTVGSDTNQAAKGEVEDRASGEEEASSEQGSEGRLKECVAKLLDERLSELERQLHGYVDSKLAKLEMQLVTKLNKLSERIDTLCRQSQNSDSEQCNSSKSNGIVSFMQLSEDQQLD